jgi:hypothetical protein
MLGRVVRLSEGWGAQTQYYVGSQSNTGCGYLIDVKVKVQDWG